MGPASAERAGLGYQPGIDGLRAVAVAAVVLYHGEGSRLPGGFLGVDAFFVISGYLITTLLVTEWVTDGGIGLRTFWARRVRRLFPALALLLVVVAGYALVLAPEVTRRALRWDGLAALAYVSNWRFVFSHQSYFEQLGGPSPLRHTWSLAVEEQWYALWPLVVLGLLTLWRRRSGRRWVDGRQPPWLVFAMALMALAIGSAAAMAWLTPASGDASRAYYGTDTHAQGLLIGAALALVLRRRPIRSAPARRAAGALGVVGLVAGLLLFVVAHDQDRWVYRGGFLLASTAWTAVLLASLNATGGPVRRLLAMPPLVALGRVSYGVYLWHWPAVVVLTPARTHWHGWALLALQTAVTVAAAVASFVLVEQPVRRGRVQAWRWWRPRIVYPATVAALAVVLLAVTLGAAPPPPAVASGRSPVVPHQPSEVLVPKRPVPGVRVPGLLVSPNVHLAGLPVPPDRPAKVTVLGDSVGFDVVWVAPPITGLELRTRAIPGCGVIRADLQVGAQRVPPSDACRHLLDEWRRAVEDKPDVVLVFLGGWEVFDPWVSGKRLAVGSAAWRSYVADQLEQGLGVLSRAPNLRIGLATVPCFPTENPVLGIPSTERNQRRRTSAVDQVVRAVAARHPDRVALVDWAGFVCPAGKDRTTLHGVRLRPDGMHPDVASDRLVWSWLAPILLALAQW